jgi:two-component system LytT family response regulator
MKALIIDDEYKAREILELMLLIHIPEIDEVKAASGALEASDVLRSFQADMVFLDIKMPEVNGFEWLAGLSERPFDIVFTTAYDQYAIQAIRYAAFDYLLKPIDPEDLRQTIDRYLDSSRHMPPAYENLLYNIEQNDPSKFRLTIPTTDGTHYLDPKEIIRCEADGNYTHFYMLDNRYILASRPIGFYGGLLPEPNFIRCHKSSLVNRYFISTINDKEMILSDGSVVPISRRRMSTVKELMLK